MMQFQEKLLRDEKDALMFKNNFPCKPNTTHIS